jgi:Lon-like protease
VDQSVPGGSTPADEPEPSESLTSDAPDEAVGGGDVGSGDVGGGDVAPSRTEELRRDTQAARRRRAWRITAFAVAIFTVVMIGSFVRLPYFTVAPGSVRNTEALISVQGAPSYPDTTGELGYLTVSFMQATPFGMVRAWIDGDIEVLSEQDALGGRDRNENQEINRQMMSNAKDVATAVALRTLGYDVQVVGSGAIVIRIQPDTPADGLLSPGDTIVGVDGAAVTTSIDLTDALGAATPGQEVVLEVQRASAAMAVHGGGLPSPDLPVDQVRVTLGAWPDDPERPLLGVQTTTRDLTYDFPFTVTIDSGNVIGPSAGLAFTLAIVDVLTPGSLTGDRKVAVTGTISLNGDVGRVGGVSQKSAAALGVGADVLLVPVEEADVARQRVGDSIEVVPVATFIEALEALARLSGDRSVLDLIEREQSLAA